MTSIYIHRGETVEIPRFPGAQPKEFHLEISYDLIDTNSADIDANCILFNESKNLLETINLFNPQSSPDSGAQGCISYSSAQFGADDGDDADTSRFTLMLNRLDASVRAVMFCVIAPNGDFSQIDAANVTLKANNKPLIQFCLGCQGKHNALVLCALFRSVDANNWFFRNVGDATIGKQIRDIEPLMNKHLKQMVISKGGDVLMLSKGDLIDIPEVEKIVVGFGWNAAEGEMAVRSCLMMFDVRGGNFDDVYYVNKVTLDGSVQHLGEVEDSSGDKEQFGISLSKMNKTVNVIVGTITISAAEESTITAPDVLTGVYCRFLNADTGKPICKFEVAKFGRLNSQITFKLSRKSPFETTKWKLEALATPMNVNSVVDLIPEVQENYADLWDQLFKWTRTEITVVSATGLQPINGKKSLSNPFVRITIDKDKKAFIKSPVERKTINPTWDFSFELGAVSVSEIEILHEGSFGTKFLGKVVADVHSLPLEVENDVFLNLTGKGNNSKDASVTGSVHLRIVKKK